MNPEQSHLTPLQSIFTMVLDMNPNYNSTASVSGLEAGDAAPALNCAKNFATGNSEQTNAQVWAIKQLAGYWNNPAGECFRMSCGDTTGVYVSYCLSGPLMGKESSAAD